MKSVSLTSVGDEKGHAQFGRRHALLAAQAGPVLVYTLAGSTFKLARALARAAYKGLWFDPRTGETRPLDAPPTWGKGTTISKPTGEDWLLLLTKK